MPGMIALIDALYFLQVFFLIRVTISKSAFSISKPFDRGYYKTVKITPAGEKETWETGSVL